jgi:hypothetical protein
MTRKTASIILLFVLAALMSLASGQHGSYFCVSPWAGGGPAPQPETNAHP